jgi:hypothetical protein
MTPCSVVVGYQRFGGPCNLYLQGEMKMEAHNSTGHHDPEDFDLKNKRSLEMSGTGFIKTVVSNFVSVVLLHHSKR